MFERFFTPYHAGTAVVGERIAILAPHPDDEIFGCGASASKWQAQGKQVKSFVLTAGVVRNEFSDQSDAEQKRLAKALLRANESKAAAKVLGLPEPEFLNAQDGELWDNVMIASELAERLQAWQPTTIVAPSIWEMHRDHRATAEIAIRLAQTLPSVKRLCFYEIGVPLIANVIEDVTAFKSLKWQAMQCFLSQLASQHYAEQINGLNIYRTYTLGLDTQYAEAFYSVDVAELEPLLQEYAPTQTTLALKNAEQYTYLLQQRLVEQQEQVQQLETALQQMYSSRSWRITSPMRKLSSWLKRLSVQKK
ncbi:PIG-L deacetylase family protein [Marinomonas fungiae]|uniref:N-acetylglucosaminyl deacetylase, LmbE family n=1 Tax=Marinomonas fungiae TaxID=1137284 RepID=A0A0K6II70_9GAMM|nr:PIG-L family deacetylase [Marinomonas fungiae]CUB02766.1 N-acetylglucosaminyl deacetylase, LmbE family [Marinomonas fungiae]